MNIPMLQPNEEERNFYRLAMLTMTEGTVAVRKAVTGRLRQPLHMILMQKADKIRSLNRGNRPLLSNRQMAILYPSNGSNCDLSAIDMTLWCVLARNLLSLPKGVTWSDDEHPPLPGQDEWYHDVSRIRMTRNAIFHLQRAEVDNMTFDDLWNRVSGALFRLNPEIDFESYRNAEYDRVAARELQFRVKEQVLEEMNDVLKSGLADRRRIYVVIIIFAILIVLLIGIASLIIYFQLRKETTCGSGKRFEVIGDIGILTILPREGWKAEKPKNDMEDQKHHNIIEYTHTADVAQCSDCCAQIYNIQYLHMHVHGWSDIGLHYFIDRDGLVYEGRNAKKVPAAVQHWNHKITSVAFMGNYMYDIPTVAALSAFNMLIKYIVDNDNVDRNFTIYAMCEIYANYTQSPGIHLYDAVNDPANARRFKYFRNVGHRTEGHCANLTSQQTVSSNSEVYYDL